MFCGVALLRRIFGSRRYRFLTVQLCRRFFGPRQ